MGEGLAMRQAMAFTCFVMAAVTCAVACAQYVPPPLASFTYGGRVVDLETGLGIAGAHVRVSYGSDTLDFWTDAAGEYHLMHASPVDEQTHGDRARPPFPNPANATIVLPVDAPGLMEVFDLRGRRVLGVRLDGYSVTVAPADPLPAGVYLTRMTGDLGPPAHSKFTALDWVSRVSVVLVTGDDAGDAASHAVSRQKHQADALQPVDNTDFSTCDPAWIDVTADGYEAHVRPLLVYWGGGAYEQWPFFHVFRLAPDTTGTHVHGVAVSETADTFLDDGLICFRTADMVEHFASIQESGRFSLDFPGSYSDQDSVEVYTRDIPGRNSNTMAIGRMGMPASVGKIAHSVFNGYCSTETLKVAIADLVRPRGIWVSAMHDSLLSDPYFPGMVGRMEWGTGTQSVVADTMRFLLSDVVYDTAQPLLPAAATGMEEAVMYFAGQFNRNSGLKMIESEICWITRCSGCPPICPPCRNRGGTAYFSVYLTSYWSPGNWISPSGCQYGANCGAMHDWPSPTLYSEIAEALGLHDSIGSTNVYGFQNQNGEVQLNDIGAAAFVSHWLYGAGAFCSWAGGDTGWPE
jgi:hypothetical protein